MGEDSFKKIIRSYKKSHRWFFIVLALLLVLSVALCLLLPLSLKIFADYVFGHQPLPGVIKHLSRAQLLTDASIGTVLIATALAVLAGLSRRVTERMKQVIDREITLEAFTALSTVPYNNPKRLSADESLYLISEQSGQLSHYLIGNFVTFGRWKLTFIGVVVVFAMVSWQLAGIVGAAALALLLIGAYSSKTFQQQADSSEAAAKQATGFIEDSLQKLRLVQEYAKEKSQVRKLEAAIRSRDQRTNHLVAVTQNYALLAVLVIGLTAAVVLINGGKQVLAGQLTFGDLLFLLAYLTILLGQFSAAEIMLGARREQVLVLRQVAENLRQAQAMVPVSGTLELAAVTGKVELRHVKLQGTYKLIFTDLNLVMEPQSLTAVIGASGSGKSSLLSLFNGFMSPTTGRVLLDGTSLSELDPDFLRRNVAMVEQESLTMNTTIAENIAFGDAERPNNLPDVMAAAVVSNATEFIDTLANNYQTPITNDLLSGGQKQRLSIARAYYTKTPVVVMDEPTAALDRRSAEIFAENLLTYFRNRTVLIATHDLALLRKAKNVYILQDKQLLPVPDITKLDLEKYRLIG